MRIGIASDHGGFDLKRKIAPSLKQAGFDVTDFGALQLDPADDYPVPGIIVNTGTTCNR